MIGYKKDDLDTRQTQQREYPKINFMGTKLDAIHDDGALLLVLLKEIENRVCFMSVCALG